MNKKIREALKAINDEKGWGTKTQQDLIDTLTDYCRVIYKEHRGERRWWTEEFRVARVTDDLFVGYDWAVANRDESIYELGWEFDPNSICEVEAVEVTVIRYEKVA